jgi:hypothetical protein
MAMKIEKGDRVNRGTKTMPEYATVLFVLGDMAMVTWESGGRMVLRLDRIERLAGDLPVLHS